MNLSLKKRKPIVYISLGIYLSLIGVIIGESSIPGGPSGEQSNVFAKIGAWVINVFNPPRVPSSILPNGFGEVTDFSYIGKDSEGVTNLVKGTTTLISIPVTYPNRDNITDLYNHDYTLSYPIGNKDDYDVIASTTSSNDTFTINLRVVTYNISSPLYGIDVTVGEDITYPYRFKIVDLVEPTSYETIISKTNLKIGETSKITTKLIDGRNKDTYLRRFYDERKIPRDSSNKDVASIDEYGVVHGLKEGTSTITFGKYSFDVVVSNEEITSPSPNSLNLEIVESSKTNPSLLDYDYVFEKGNSPDDYSTLLKASFSDPTLLDKSVTFNSDDNIKVKLAPHHYDENGFPSYIDSNGDYYVRVSGYRKKGEVTIRCMSNVDNSVYRDITLDVDEVTPSSMEVNIGSKYSAYVNEQVVIKASFEPKNVNNKNIHIDVLEGDRDIVSISNNDSSNVIITGSSVSIVSIRVTSLANPSLSKDVRLEFTARPVIDGDNFNDFAGFIRKAAGHFSLFLVTAVFGVLFFYFYLDDVKKWWVGLSITLGVGFIVASISELIQFYIPGRSGVWSDVGIDFVGYLIGTVVTISVVVIIMIFKNKKNKEY